MSRRDPATSNYVFRCDKTNPFRGLGLKPGASVLHASAHVNHRTNHRVCDVCGTDLGLDYERGWEKKDREESARRAAAEMTRNSFSAKVAARADAKAAKAEEAVPA